MPALLGVLVGLSLGLTGGGGSIFAVPLLIYGLGVAPRDAVTVSLVAVAATAAFGAIGASRAKLVEYRAGLVFSAGGILAAPLGVRASRFVSESTIVTAFAGLMVIVALLMWRNASRRPADAAVVRAGFLPGADDTDGPLCRLSPDQRLRLNAPCSAVLTVSGLGTGILSGFFGVGGGFVIVPALTFVTQLGIHRAVATSLFVIALVSLAALGSVLALGAPPPVKLVAWFGGGGLVGMYLGRLVAQRIAGPSLQRIFAVAILTVGVVVLSERL